MYGQRFQIAILKLYPVHFPMPDCRYCLINDQIIFQLGEHVSDSMKNGLVGQMWHHAIETFFVPNWLWLIVSIVTFRYGVHFLIAVITEVKFARNVYRIELG